MTRSPARHSTSPSAARARAGACRLPDHGNGLPVVQAAAAPEEAAKPPLTHSEAAMQCWMSVEKGRADASLDKRADVVTKCINDKMTEKPRAPRLKAEAARGRREIRSLNDLDPPDCAATIPPLIRVGHADKT